MKIGKGVCSIIVGIGLGVVTSLLWYVERTTNVSDSAQAIAGLLAGSFFVAVGLAFIWHGFRTIVAATNILPFPLMLTIFGTAIVVMGLSLSSITTDVRFALVVGLGFIPLGVGVVRINKSRHEESLNRSDPVQRTR